VVTARELRKRNAKFLSRSPSYRYDEQRTVHLPQCNKRNFNAQMEPCEDLKQAAADPASSANVHSSAAAANGGAAASSASAAAAPPSASSSSSASPPCGCPVLVRRGMFVQVNRAFERLLGWSQADMRTLFVHSGQRGAMCQLLNYGHSADSALEFHALNHLTLGRVDFSSCQPVRNRAGHQQTCIVQGRILTSDNGDPDGTIFTFIAC